MFRRPALPRPVERLRRERRGAQTLVVDASRDLLPDTPGISIRQYIGTHCSECQAEREMRRSLLGGGGTGGEAGRLYIIERLG